MTRGETASLLVFEDRGSERKALLLDVVERIESVAVDEIEYAGGRPMLQYRGELLQLDDEGGVLDGLREARLKNGGAMATVLICGSKNGDSQNGRMRSIRKRDGSGVRRRGRVVRRVLDVTEGTWLEGEVSRSMVCGEVDLALVNERVTMVCGSGAGLCAAD